MDKFAIIVHGGAGPDSNFIRDNQKKILEGLEEAIEKGYEILKNHGKATEAVEAAVNALEDNPLFNAGRGSALTAKAEVEMCASIMDGRTLNSGAVAIIKNVKNPVSLARSVMANTKYIYLGDAGAMEYAKKINIHLRPDSYFITPHQYDEYEKLRKEEAEHIRDIALEDIAQKMHGTVGAVALDMDGNLAAATSTGGTANAKPGRIGDSSMIGVGTYADNKTCAASGTGDGEYLIRGVITHSISQHMTYRRSTVTEAAKEVVHSDNKDIKGHIGVIGVDRDANIALEFNCDRMLRAWKKGNHATVSKIYR
jgi:beta-aspartyl-peptidase (threonine type)